MKRNNLLLSYFLLLVVPVALIALPVFDDTTASSIEGSYDSIQKEAKSTTSDKKSQNKPKEKKKRSNRSGTSRKPRKKEKK